MSIWTHAAGIVVFNSFSMDDERLIDDLDRIFGKECLWRSSRSVKEDARCNPESYMPKGSEGSLRKILDREPHSDIAVLSIHGDLRDYSSPGKIIKWFQNSVKEADDRFIVRQAVITVQCELDVKPMTWVYENEK